jgi:cytidylate kinase
MWGWRMIICISGLSGSGKNSVGEEVAKLLRLRVVNPTFKTIAARQKMTLMEFHRKAEKEHSIDRRFDEELVAQAKRGNCVVTTWLGPWMVKGADIKVWLYAPQAVRAQRVAGRDSITVEQALAHISDRDESNHHRYNEVYHINIYDHSGFELVINTEKFAPKESARIIAEAARALGEKAGKKTAERKAAGNKKAAVKQSAAKKKRGR